MKPPLGAGSLLPEEVWQAVRLQTIFGCCKWDVQSEDQCVLARFPLQLAQSEWRRLANRAEALSTEALAAEQEIMHREELHGRLGLPRGVRKALRHFEEPDRCMGAARVMRFDFHFTDTFLLPPAQFVAPRFDVFGYVGYIGTSMAAPHVAGVAAMLMQQGVTDPAAIEEVLEKTAIDLGKPGRDDEFGFGLVDARAALRGLGLAK